jgi:hypothetical protein
MEIKVKNPTDTNPLAKAKAGDLLFYGGSTFPILFLITEVLEVSNDKIKCNYIAFGNTTVSKGGLFYKTEYKLVKSITIELDE